MESFIVKHTDHAAVLSDSWESDIWCQSNTLLLQKYAKKTCEHFPRTEIRMLYDNQNIYGLFQVQDQYVRAVQEHNQGPVCTDSCVEFFVQPQNETKYFNFEINCGGTMLLYHITHCRSGKYVKLPQSELDKIERFHTLPKIVDPEITIPITWRLGFRIPLSFFAAYFPINTNLSGQIWRANFTKCGNRTSHPHWLTWMPLSKPDFHLPDEFGNLIFE